MKLHVFIIFLAILVIPELGRADGLPATGLIYDLQEAGLFGGDTKHPGVLNQLKDVSFVRSKANDLDEVYTLKAIFNETYNGVSYGQATELFVVDIATGQAVALFPKNITLTGEHKCLPVVSGSTAKFSCIYSLKANKITDTSKIYMLLSLSNFVILSNVKAMEIKDFVPATPTCTVPQVLSADGKSCVAPPAPACGDHQGLLNGSCVCSAGFVTDAKTKACVPDPALAAIPPPTPPGGKNCSLNPAAPSDPIPQTILALLLATMVAARACLYSRN